MIASTCLACPHAGGFGFRLLKVIYSEIMSYIQSHIPRLTISHDFLLWGSLGLCAVFIVAEFMVVYRRKYSLMTKGSSFEVKQAPAVQCGFWSTETRADWYYLRLGDSDFKYPERHMRREDPYDSPCDYRTDRELLYSPSSSGILRSPSSQVLSAISSCSVSSFRQYQVGVCHWTGGSQQRLSCHDLAGLDAHGTEILEMMAAFPDASKGNLMRFLIACNGDARKAVAMYENHCMWRERRLPPTRHLVADVFKLGSVFSYGTAKSGSPILFYRGAFYDKSVGSVDQHVLAMAYAIDRLVGRSPTGLITIVAQACAVQGAPNTPIDTDFVSAFVKVVMDHFPERLDKFILYPFPWWGRAIWSFFSAFIDSRTQSRVNLYSDGGGDTIPKEILQHISLEDIPQCMGGAGADDKAGNFLEVLDEELAGSDRDTDEHSSKDPESKKGGTNMGHEGEAQAGVQENTHGTRGPAAETVAAHGREGGGVTGPKPLAPLQLEKCPSTESNSDIGMSLDSPHGANDSFDSIPPPPPLKNVESLVESVVE